MELSEIIEKADILFRKFGIRSITMDDISKEMGISKKTLYQYITDKNELVEKVVFAEIERLKECAGHSESISGMNALEQLMNVGKNIKQVMNSSQPAREYDLKKYYPALYKELQRFKLEIMQFSMLRNLELGKEQGLYRREMNQEHITRFYISRIEDMIECKSLMDDSEMPAGYFEEIFRYHIMGIVNDTGRTFFLENQHRFLILPEVENTK
jgi:TetR/AcrR family transcriptional regulator, cholesterol catabolism regulator